MTLPRWPPPWWQVLIAIPFALWIADFGWHYARIGYYSFQLHQLPETPCTVALRSPPLTEMADYMYGRIDPRYESDLFASLMYQHILDENEVFICELHELDLYLRAHGAHYSHTKFYSSDIRYNYDFSYRYANLITFIFGGYIEDYMVETDLDDKVTNLFIIKAGK